MITPVRFDLRVNPLRSAVPLNTAYVRTKHLELDEDFGLWTVQ